MLYLKGESILTQAINFKHIDIISICFEIISISCT